MSIEPKYAHIIDEVLTDAIAAARAAGHMGTQVRLVTAQNLFRSDNFDEEDEDEDEDEDEWEDYS